MMDNKNVNELIMLGTGNAIVTKCYNTCFVLRSGTTRLLVDGRRGWWQWRFGPAGEGGRFGG